MCDSLSLSLLGLGPRALADDSAPLPGPGLDVPVDVDGDGVSSYGDRWAFNYWLERGGNLAEALSQADVGKRGTIDLSAFFRSSAALLAPKQPDQAAAAGGGGGVAGAGACTSATVTHPGSGTIIPPECLFQTGRFEFDFPTGFDFDASRRLWVSRSLPGDLFVSGTARLSLSQAPPNGTIPLPAPTICNNVGYLAEGIAVRKTPVDGHCSAEPHVLNTWPDSTIDQICRTADFATCEQCSFCVEARGYCAPPCILPPTPTEPAGEPLIDDPFGIDVVRDGMPPDFGAVDDFIFSDKAAGQVRIRLRRSTGVSCDFAHGTVKTLITFGSVAVCGGGTKLVDKVLSVALGDFKGNGQFGAYYVTKFTDGSREVRRLTFNGATGQFQDTCFAGLPAGNKARSLEFDRFRLIRSGALAGSGDLFVSEEESPGRIWRINKNGVVRDFGTGFVEPNGIAFHPSGVMLVSHDPSTDPDDGNVLVVDGWRNMFNRGDANADGSVNITDMVFISNYLQSISNPEPPCFDAADANDDDSITTVDISFLGNFLFLSGPPPPEPFQGTNPLDWCPGATVAISGPNTTIDPNVDLLGCASYRNCAITW